jgi:uncharacterized protein YybS (DUF2232 family)
MVGEAVVMVEAEVAVMAEASVVGMVEASAVAVVISLGIVLPAIASQNTKERTLRGTKIISGTEIILGTTAISFLEVPLGTEIPIRMITRITDIMTTMTATITMGNTHQPK